MAILKQIIFVAIICTIIIYIGGCSMTNQKSKQVEQGMREYLNKKYGMEFEFVKKPYLTGNEGFGNIYQAKVIPVGKPELEFFVEGDKSNTGAYIDGYLQVKWTYEGKQEIEKKIKEVYGSETDFVLKYTFRYNNEEFKDLNHDEVLAKCNSNAHIDMVCNIFSDEKFDKYAETEKAYKILKPYFLDNKISYYIFNIRIYSKEYKEKYVSLGTHSDKRSDDTLYKDGLLINYLYAYNIREVHPIEIENSSDLIKYFKY